MVEYDAGTVKATMKADGTGLHSEVERAKKDYTGLKDTIVSALNEVNQAERKTSQEQEAAARKSQQAAKQQADAAREQEKAIRDLGITAGVAFGAMVAGAFKAIDANNQLKASMQGLDSVATGNVGSYEKIKKELQRIQENGLIPLTNATQAYKNLISRYQDEETAIKMFNKIADAAAFGRQAHLSLGEAIQGTSEGLKNEMSNLTDNGGITKNLSIMWKEYAATLGKTVGQLTEAEKRQAEVNGFMTEGRFQTGDLAKLQQQLAGQMAKTTAETNLTAAAFGDALEPAVGAANLGFQAILKSVRSMIQASPELAAGVSAGALALTGLTAAGAAWNLVWPKVKAGFTFMKGSAGIALIAISALTSVIVGLVTAAKKAREETAKLANKYRDESVEAKDLINEYKNLQKIVKPTADQKQRMYDITKRIKEILPDAAVSYDKEGNAILNVNSALREMILLKGQELRLRLRELDSTDSKNEKKLKSLNGEIAKQEAALAQAKKANAELEKQGQSGYWRTNIVEQNLAENKRQRETLRNEIERNQKEKKAIENLLEKGITPDDIKPVVKPETTTATTTSGGGNKDKRTPYDIAKDQFETFAASGASAESQLAKWHKLTNAIKNTLKGEELDDYKKKLTELEKAAEDAVQKAQNELALTKITDAQGNELAQLKMSYEEQTKGMRNNDKEKIALTEKYNIERQRITEKWGKEKLALEKDIEAIDLRAKGDYEAAALAEEEARYAREINDLTLTVKQKEKIEKEHQEKVTQIRRDYAEQRAAVDLEQRKGELDIRIQGLETEKQMTDLWPDEYAAKQAQIELEKEIVKLKKEQLDLDIKDLERQQKATEDPIKKAQLQNQIDQAKLSQKSLQSGLDYDIASYNFDRSMYTETRESVSSAIQAAFDDGGIKSGWEALWNSLANNMKRKLVDALSDSIMNSTFGQSLQSGTNSVSNFIGSLFGNKASNTNTDTNANTDTDTGANTNTGLLGSMSNFFKNNKTASSLLNFGASTAIGAAAGGNNSSATTGAALGSLLGMAIPGLGTALGGMAGGLLGGLFGGGSDTAMTISANTVKMDIDFASANFKTVTLPKTYMSSQSGTTKNTNSVAPIINVNINAAGNIITENDLKKSMTETANEVYSARKVASDKWSEATVNGVDINDY